MSCCLFREQICALFFLVLFVKYHETDLILMNDISIVQYVFSFFTIDFVGKSFQICPMQFSHGILSSIQWNHHLLPCKAISNSSAPITALDSKGHILNVALAFLQAMLNLYMFKKLILLCCSWRCTRSHAERGDWLECSHTKELLLTLSEAQLH